MLNYQKPKIPNSNVVFSCYKMFLLILSKELQKIFIHMTVYVKSS